MKKKCFAILIWFGILLFTACTSGKVESIEEVELTRTITVPVVKSVVHTFLPTVTKKPTPMPLKATVTPTATLFSRQILISYQYNANDSMPSRIACLSGLDTENFLLFDDGQLIIYIDDQFMETILNQDEIDALMAEIESTGLFMIKNEEDMFTDIPPDRSLFWYSWVQLKVKSEIYIYDLGQADYLVDAVNKAIDILRNYRPDQFTPYFPEKINIWVQQYHGFNSDMEFGKPDSPQLSWSDEPIIVNKLEEHAGDLSDEELSFIMQEIEKVPANQLVEQNGQVYQVMICPELPD
jgi:hypothetical protein